MSEKNVAIRYLGGCGGHFVNYFLLASGKYATRYYITNKNKNKKLKIDIRPGDVKIVSRLFYQQFGDKREWLSDEIWPDNTKCNFSPRLFLYCDDGTPKKNKDIINVCPYISDFKDWFRTVLYKRTNLFRGIDPTLSTVKKFYKEKSSKKYTSFKKVPGCDYYFDIMQFVNNLSTRKKLCDFLQIDHTDLMEEFVYHYNDCHKELKKKTSW